MRTSKEILIKGQNEINAIAKDCIKKIVPLLKNTKEAKVFKVDGSLTKKHEHIKEAIPTNKQGFKVGYFSISDYGNITLRIKTCLSGGSYENNTYYCEYFDKDIYLGTVKNGVV